jgi:hypothetical protein
MPKMIDVEYRSIEANIEIKKIQRKATRTSALVNLVGSFKIRLINTSILAIILINF